MRLIAGELRPTASDLAGHLECRHLTQLEKAVALGAFHDVLTKMSHIDIRTGQETGVLALKLRQQVRRELKPYGVRVLKARLTDLAPGKVLRLIQSTSTDGI